MRRAIQEGVIVSTVTLMGVAQYFRAIEPVILSERIDIITNLSTLKIIDFISAIMQSTINFMTIYAGLGLGLRDCAILATTKAA